MFIGSVSGKSKSVTLQTAELGATGKPYGHGTEARTDVPEGLGAGQAGLCCAVPVILSDT